MKKNRIAQKMADLLRDFSGTHLNAGDIHSHLERIDHQNSLLSSGSVIYSLFNHVTFKFDYMSPNVKQILGVSAKRLMALDYQTFLEEYFHPEDLQIISQNIFPDLGTYVNQHEIDPISRISINYSYRMKTARQKWIRIEQQASPVQSNGKDEILLTQSFYQLVGEAEEERGNPITLSIFISDSDGLYHLEHSKTYATENNKTSNSITPREMEILTLLAEGKTSSQIGKILYISESTVITHRKNMLEKFGLKNTSELIAYAFKTGILEI
ncbi:LuxR C-terminal-related transcriptional regulator [Fodinibius sediminis]|nr:LuxR C-terminal-related transcriptional regulator [Fodinibius sediminis]